MKRLLAGGFADIFVIREKNCSKPVTYFFPAATSLFSQPDFMRIFSILTILVVFFAACTPSLPDQPATPLSYGDTLFYNQPVQPVVISPVSRPAAPGYFKAIPLGLAMDTLTGNIDISASEPGLKYKVFYIAADHSRVLDSVRITVSGIDYQDSIYSIAAGSQIAPPIYNADPGLLLPCGDDDDDDDGNGDDDDDDSPCVFDETDINGDGSDDVPGVNPNGLLVNRDNGQIDLNGSISAGLLGANPANGTSGDFAFYYRINDATLRTLQEITVRVYYYNTRNDIPAALLAEMGNRNIQSADVLMRRFDQHRVNTLYTLPADISRSGIMRAVPSIKGGPKRPPIIIIVGR